MADRSGFTLVELVVVLVVLGILAAVAVPRMGRMHDATRQGVTQAEMQVIKSAILGTPDRQGTPRGGFEIDVGHPPGRLVDLVVKPDSLDAWDPFLGRGWNGPYLDSTGGHFLRDAWDSTYVYDAAARTLTSVGGGSNLALSF